LVKIIFLLIKKLLIAKYKIIKIIKKFEIRFL
jgi:hypothetical protein